jgi:putative ABC transport system substrate-binding protein
VKRREFITLLGGATAWPLAARAQQSSMPAIEFLSSRSSAESANHLKAFRQGLREVGYVEGRNVAIEYRWANGNYDQLPNLASELVLRPVDVIAAAGGNVTALAAGEVAKSTPLAFIVGADPVTLGLVNSLNRPGGNATGVSIFTSELGPKRLEILNELLRKASKIALLINPAYPGSATDVAVVQALARRIGATVLVLNASNEQEIDTIFAALSDQRVDALLVTADALFVSRRDQLVALSARNAIPTLYDLRDFVVAGGLMSYGPSLAEAYRQLGIYAGKILSGKKPADLPVQQAVKFEFVINLKAAKALGLEIPPNLLALADEVIE